MWAFTLSIYLFLGVKCLVILFFYITSTSFYFYTVYFHAIKNKHFISTDTVFRQLVGAKLYHSLFNVNVNWNERLRYPH